MFYYVVGGKNYIRNKSSSSKSSMCMYQNIEGKIWVELKSRTEGNLYSIEAQRLGLRIFPLYYNFKNLV